MIGGGERREMKEQQFRKQASYLSGTAKVLQTFPIVKRDNLPSLPLIKDVTAMASGGRRGRQAKQVAATGDGDGESLLRCYQKARGTERERERERREGRVTKQGVVMVVTGGWVVDTTDWIEDEGEEEEEEEEE